MEKGETGDLSDDDGFFRMNNSDLTILQDQAKWEQDKNENYKDLFYLIHY